jgi:uncharacterized phage-like protein YoqJ
MGLARWFKRKSAQKEYDLARRAVMAFVKEQQQWGFNNYDRYQELAKKVDEAADKFRQLGGIP